MVPLFLSPRRVWRFYRDPKTAWGPKLGLFLAIAYLIMPIDLVPDLMPLVGWLDDVGAVGLALGWLERTLRKAESLPQDP